MADITFRHDKGKVKDTSGINRSVNRRRDNYKTMVKISRQTRVFRTIHTKQQTILIHKQQTDKDTNSCPKKKIVPRKLKIEQHESH